jgi:hypothetical protein
MKQRCTTCDSASVAECAQCRAVSYCSRACQAMDWSVHQVECNVQRARAAFPEGGPEEAYTWIDEHLAMGDLASLGNAALMAQVKAIVSLGSLPDSRPRPPVGGREVPWLHIPIPDRALENIGRYLEAAYQFIVAAPGPVYLHCHAGISRSGTVAIYYWARSRNVSLTDAIRAIVSKRGQVWPNEGFLCQLEDALAHVREQNLGKGPCK